MKNPKNIAITGASSGIGAALARHYAKAGITLHLHGRNGERLSAVARDCSAKGATVYARTGYVTDTPAMEAWLKEADIASPLDLVIANAGISAGTGIHGESADQARYIFITNIDGVLNTALPAITLMTGRHCGQIALMSSLAGLRGLPSCPAYSASKAWARLWGEGLRAWLAPQGVEVSVICPGYVKTAMTAVNDFPMPFIMEAEKAARIIAGGLARNKARIAFPLRLYWLMRVVACLPVAWMDPLLARLPAKPSQP